jgi:hypothetical protein
MQFKTTGMRSLQQGTRCPFRGSFFDLFVLRAGFVQMERALL